MKIRKTAPNRTCTSPAMVLSVTIALCFQVGCRQSEPPKKDAPPAIPEKEQPTTPEPEKTPVPEEPAAPEVKTDVANENATSPTKHGLKSKTNRVVFVVVDTERADATEPFGSSLPTTPFLAELAAQGITFKRTFSTSSWTPPAMFSIITGLYPGEHGMTEGVNRDTLESDVPGTQQILSQEAVTLAEVLQENGYTTFGINTNFNTSAKFGFGQGFDVFFGRSFTRLPFANMAVSSVSKDYKKAKKSFLWLLYFDPHFPYNPIAPWFDEWNDTKFKTEWDFAISMTLDLHRNQRHLKLDDTFALDDLYPLITLSKKMARTLTRKQGLITYELEYLNEKQNGDYNRFLKAAYLSEVRNTDEAMREALLELGMDDQTLIVVTSDHGEELLDHGWYGHRQSLFQELVHVPLVIRLPGKIKAGTVIDTPVSLVDLYPTLLDLLGIPIPDNLSGVSLVPLIEGKEIQSRDLYLEVDGQQGQMRGLVQYPWKLIHNLSDSSDLLFNLEKDPKERKDLSAGQPARVEKMRQILLTWVKQSKVRWNDNRIKRLSRREIKQLRKMGYVQ